jgi:hypothetical protein
MKKIRIRDPGWKKAGSRVNIPDPQHWFQHGKFKTKERDREGRFKANTKANVSWEK